MVQMAERVPAARTLEELARPLLEMLQTVTGLESTYLTTIDEAGGVQHVLFANNSSQMQIPEGLTVPWGDTLCKRALDEGRPYTDNVAEHWGDSDAARELGIRTYLSRPVHTDTGGLYGTLCAASAHSVPMSAEAERVLGMFSHLIAQHVEREQLLERLQQANAQLSNYALTDALTGLPNRRSLSMELGRMLARAQRDGSRLHVAFVDLDGFKAINDRHGHEAGDRFLAEMAARLANALRAGDLVARLGGDEFVIVAPAREEGSAELLRERLSRTTIGQFDLGVARIDYPGASVGVVTSTAGDIRVDELLNRADAAMYEIKRTRRKEA